jgi:hypothetical protein
LPGPFCFMGLSQLLTRIYGTPEGVPFHNQGVYFPKITVLEKCELTAM